MIAEVCDHNEILHNAPAAHCQERGQHARRAGIARDALNATSRFDADEWGRECDESLIEEAERLVDGDTARMRDIKQTAVDACQSVQNEIEAGATFVKYPASHCIADGTSAWLDIESEAATRWMKSRRYLEHV